MVGIAAVLRQLVPDRVYPCFAPSRLRAAVKITSPPSPGKNACRGKLACRPG